MWRRGIYFETEGTLQKIVPSLKYQQKRILWEAKGTIDASTVEQSFIHKLSTC